MFRNNVTWNENLENGVMLNRLNIKGKTRLFVAPHRMTRYPSDSRNPSDLNNS